MILPRTQDLSEEGEEIWIPSVKEGKGMLRWWVLTGLEGRDLLKGTSDGMGPAVFCEFLNLRVPESG